MFRNFCIAATLVAMCSSASAAVVTAEFKETDTLGTWELWVSALPEGGDTQGIAGYAFSLTGLQALGVDSGAVVWTESKLSVIDPVEFQPRGFGSVSSGAVGANEYSAANIQPNGAAAFRIMNIGAQDVNQANGAPTGPVVTGVPALLGRLVVPGAPALTAANFNVGISLFPTPFVANAPYIEADVALTVIPGGIVDDPVFESDPATGGTLDFGYGGQNRTVSLATRNVGGGTIEVADFQLLGDDAALFAVNTSPFSLVGGAGNTDVEIEFLAEASGGPGTYSATLNLLDGAGGVIGTYDLTAQVPEPSTVALAGLGLVGLVGLARRRG